MQIWQTSLGKERLEFRVWRETVFTGLEIPYTPASEFRAEERHRERSLIQFPGQSGVLEPAESGRKTRGCLVRNAGRKSTFPLEGGTERASLCPRWVFGPWNTWWRSGDGEGPDHSEKRVSWFTTREKLLWVNIREEDGEWKLLWYSVTSAIPGLISIAGLNW